MPKKCSTTLSQRAYEKGFRWCVPVLMLYMLSRLKFHCCYTQIKQRLSTPADVSVSEKFKLLTCLGK